MWMQFPLKAAMQKQNNIPHKKAGIHWEANGDLSLNCTALLYYSHMKIRKGLTVLL